MKLHQTKKFCLHWYYIITQNSEDILLIFMDIVHNNMGCKVEGKYDVLALMVTFNVFIKDYSKGITF